MLIYKYGDLYLPREKDRYLPDLLRLLSLITALILVYCTRLVNVMLFVPSSIAWIRVVYMWRRTRSIFAGMTLRLCAPSYPEPDSLPRNFRPLHACRSGVFPIRRLRGFFKSVCWARRSLTFDALCGWEKSLMLVNRSSRVSRGRGPIENYTNT